MAKEKLQKLKYFTMQKYNLQKILYKRDPKSFKILYKSITNLKFQHEPKISSFKNPCMKTDLLYYLEAKIHSATVLYNESKHKYPLPW
jgi:hypothetical protein